MEKSPAAPTIAVRDLRKVYMVSQQEGEAASGFSGILNRKKTEVAAVDGITFEVAPGEVVGFLGPNGAGKTTTLKMLSGLLYPTSGTISVLGKIPWQREADYLRQITLIMGQRNQLVWDIPAIRSFELNRAIYQIPQADFDSLVKELTDLLDLGPLLYKPVRNLSLGERMKCEFAAALLHRPGVVFLDEPTIGLDVTMQHRLRDFVAEYNRRYNATVLLTSHYMADVEALCKRVMVIHHGRLLFDGNLVDLVQKFTSYKTIVIQTAECGADMSAYGEVTSCESGRYTLRIPKAQTAAVTARLLAELQVIDLLVEDPPIEEVIERVFAQEIT
jgi:ABC-2 type transport system ATP-binding protein